MSQRIRHEVIELSNPITRTEERHRYRFTPTPHEIPSREQVTKDQ